MTKSKLDTRLDPTGTKQELKFTDYSIDKYQPNFEGKDCKTEIVSVMETHTDEDNLLNISIN